MNINLRYGDDFVPVNIPDHFKTTVLEPIQPAVKFDLAQLNRIIHEACDIQKLSTANTIAIAINDKTRPVNYGALLPPLLALIREAAGAFTKVTLFIASGTHKPMTSAEVAAMLPEMVAVHYPVIVHDCDDIDTLLSLGSTSRGTPILINRHFLQADYKIVVGNIEPHHFMGYSGGVKTAAIGLAGRRTIQQNHSMLLNEPFTQIGEYERNPMRMDVEEIGDKIGIDLVVNAVQDHHKNLVRVFAGIPRHVMTRALPIVRSICQLPLTTRYPLVIASAGGYPKDINLYQAQKAITNAARFTANGGELILLAECREGLGNQHFETFMQGIASVQQIRDKLTQSGFAVGPHKAFLLARDLERIKISLVSSLTEARVKLALLYPVKPQDLGQYLETQLESDLNIAIIPNAVAIIPDSE